MLSERNKGNRELEIPASAADHLRRIILQRLDLANDAQMCATETPWASITFTGARHLFTLTVDDYEIAKRMLETLDEDEFDIPDHLVADVAVTVTEIDSRRAIQLEILTVESG